MKQICMVCGEEAHWRSKDIPEIIANKDMLCVEHYYEKHRAEIERKCAEIKKWTDEHTIICRHCGEDIFLWNIKNPPKCVMCYECEGYTEPHKARKKGEAKHIETSKLLGW